MCGAYPDMGLGHPKMALISLPSEGPYAERVRQEWNQDLTIDSLACYLYATMVGITHFVE